MSLLADVKEMAAETSLWDTNRRLLRENERMKADRSELVDAIYRAMADNLSAIEFPPVPKPVFGGRRRGEDETAIITFSDLQLGQVTPTFNTEVAARRVAQYAEKIARLTEVQRAAHPVRRAKLYLLGDLVEGEGNIFPTQAYQVDSSLYAQVGRNGPAILGDFIRRLLAVFEAIDIVSVPGNHGSAGKAANPETNFDRLLTAILQGLFEREKRLTWKVPEGFGRTSFYAVDNVGDVGFLLWHGNQARRTSSSSHLPFYKLVMGWRSGAIAEPFSVSICGHHHTPVMLSMSNVIHFINGTFSSDAEYAIERLASSSRAAQWLLFAKPGRGLTAQYLVNLDD